MKCAWVKWVRRESEHMLDIINLVENLQRLKMGKVRGRNGGKIGRGCFVSTIFDSVALVAV